MDTQGPKRYGPLGGRAVRSTADADVADHRQGGKSRTNGDFRYSLNCRAQFVIY